MKQYFSAFFHACVCSSGAGGMCPSQWGWFCISATRVFFVPDSPCILLASYAVDFDVWLAAVYHFSFQSFFYSCILLTENNHWNVLSHICPYSDFSDDTLVKNKKKKSTSSIEEHSLNWEKSISAFRISGSIEKNTSTQEALRLTAALCQPHLQNSFGNFMDFFFFFFPHLCYLKR